MIFKARCSEIGQMMSGTVGLTDAQRRKYNELAAKERRTEKQEKEYIGLIKKAESKELPQGVKTYLEKWMKAKAFEVHIEVNSKYIKKGNAMEDPALKHLGLEKNEEFFENDFLTGTPDAIESNLVTDIKNSWDHNTFPFFETECPNKDYWWQGQGYMHLTGIHHYRLSYFLQSWEELNYDHIAMDDRIKHFYFDYDEKAIRKIEERHELCQEYVDKMWRDVRKVKDLEEW